MVETTDALVGTLGGVMALGIMANVAGKMMGDDHQRCNRRKECMRKKQEKNHPRKMRERRDTVRDSFW